MKRSSILILLALLGFAPMAWAQNFGGGSGTENDPYMIYLSSQLDQLATDVNNGTNYQGTYFALGSDIHYSPSYSQVSNYTPIGHASENGGQYTFYPFEGSFDGRGHTISGIEIYNIGEDAADCNLGVFGLLGSHGVVKHLIVDDVLIFGHNLVAGVVGCNQLGSVVNCHVTSGVTLYGVNSGNGGHGGLQPRLSGWLHQCSPADGSR